MPKRLAAASIRSLRSESLPGSIAGRVEKRCTATGECATATRCRMPSATAGDAAAFPGVLPRERENREGEEEEDEEGDEVVPEPEEDGTSRRGGAAAAAATEAAAAAAAAWAAEGEAKEGERVLPLEAVLSSALSRMRERLFPRDADGEGVPAAATEAISAAPVESAPAAAAAAAARSDSVRERYRPNADDSVAVESSGEGGGRPLACAGERDDANDDDAAAASSSLVPPRLEPDRDISAYYFLKIAFRIRHVWALVLPPSAGISDPVMRRGLCAVSAARAFKGSGVVRWAVRGAPAAEQSGTDRRDLGRSDLERRLFAMRASPFARMGSTRQVDEGIGGGGAAAQVRHAVFAGRSNAGKSTLLNTLFGRGVAGHGKLARTSKTPGRTQAVNLYGLGAEPTSPRAIVADLPGYGWARNAGSGAAHRWNQAMGLYLRGTAAEGLLARVFVLCDSRRGVVDADLDFVRFLDDEGLPYQLVFTKIDRVRRAELVDAVARAQVLLRAPGRTAFPPFALAVSCSDRAGLEGLRREVASALLGPPPPGPEETVAAGVAAEAARAEAGAGGVAEAGEKGAAL